MAAHHTNAVEYLDQCKKKNLASHDDINGACVFQGGVVAAEVIANIPRLVVAQDRTAQVSTENEDDLRLLKYNVDVGLRQATVPLRRLLLHRCIPFLI